MLQFNEKNIKCKKDLEFSTSKNLMAISNYSAKEYTNVESKSESDNGMQDESQKRKSFTDSLFNISKHHSNKIVLAHININSLTNKFDVLTNGFTGYIDTLMISKTKLDDKFWHSLYHLKDFSDRNSHDSGILVYARDIILSNLGKIDQKFENF